MSLFLGIDTSNYKTSVALVDGSGNTAADVRRFLPVKQGERGLRQQEALFHHTNALPELIEEAVSMASGQGDIVCVSASERPRPVEGSYMPVFNAGSGTARSIAAALGCPCYMFSHQEMHIEAARHGTEAEKWDRFVALHFSGGTTEALLCTDNGGASPNIEPLGGTLDISYGQVLDRAGVALGMSFPAGAELDAIALGGNEIAPKALLPAVKVSDGRLNLSGIETSVIRKLENTLGKAERDALIRLLFVRLAESMDLLIKDVCKACGADRVLLAGGASSSGYIRNWFNDNVCALTCGMSGSLSGGKEIRMVFAAPGLSTDNAVGTALLGLKRYGA